MTISQVTVPVCRLSHLKSQTQTEIHKTKTISEYKRPLINSLKAGMSGEVFTEPTDVKTGKNITMCGDFSQNKRFYKICISLSFLNNFSVIFFYIDKFVLHF